MADNPLGDMFANAAKNAGLGGLGSGAQEPSDTQKVVIGLQAKRISALEKQVSDLTNAVIILINSKDKKGTAIVPKSIRYKKPKVFVEWKDGEKDKQIGTVKIKLSE